MNCLLNKKLTNTCKRNKSASCIDDEKALFAYVLA